MRVLIAFLLTSLAACMSDPCDPDWHVEFSRAGSSSHEGADGRLARGPDDTLVLAMLDYDDIQIGDRVVSGPNIARISSDGELLGVAPAPELNGVGVFHVGVDAAGNAYIASGTPTTMTLASYGPDLQYRWKYTAPGFGYDFAFDTDDAGHVVFSLDDSSGMNNALYFLEPDGKLRWMLPLQTTYVGVTAIVGDEVHTFGGEGNGPMRYRYAAADGTRIDAIPTAVAPDPLSGGGFVVDDSGNFTTAGYAPDGSSAAIITRFATTGEQSWQRRIELRGFVGPVLSNTGDVIGQVAEDGTGFRLLVLDGATGVTKSEEPMCSHLNVIAADATHYYGIGLTGSESIGVARFSL